ncbi:CD1375 family protein [Paenibacillus sp. PK3_47]
MAKVYANLVRKGLLTLDQVHETKRAEVAELLETK